jgi:hypothetical protein
MHELPPLIHRERDRMIDVHHTILPLTARITPDADALIADSVLLENGLRILVPRTCSATLRRISSPTAILPAACAICGTCIA